MKLSKWAKKQGICYLTALNWFHSGKIPNARQISTGTILIDDEVKMNLDENVCIYARVSNQSRKSEMEYQINRIIEFTNSKGLSITKIYKEVASGMNDNRKELWKMIDSNPTKIVVEHKDRLTRFGFNYMERLLKKQGCEIIVMNKDKEDETDLIKDLVSIITSFCCRLYGLRRGLNKAKKLKEELKNE
jgi:predicted site-specific integrase-resolvase